MPANGCGQEAGLFVVHGVLAPSEPPAVNPSVGVEIYSSFLLLCFVFFKRVLVEVQRVSTYTVKKSTLRERCVSYNVFRFLFLAFFPK